MHYSEARRLPGHPIAAVEGLKGLDDVIGAAMRRRRRRIAASCSYARSTGPAVTSGWRGHIKLLWLALRNAIARSVRAASAWKAAMNLFAILCGNRFMQAGANIFFSRLVDKIAHRFVSHARRSIGD